MILTDTSAERAILAGICKFGAEAYYDIADIIDENSFTINSNQVIYACLKRIFEQDDTRKIDVPSILSCAKELGLQDFFNNNNEISHLSAILKFPIILSNVRKFAAKIRKLQIARMMCDQLEETKNKYLTLKGDEPISHILGLAEESIFDFTSILNDQEESPQKVFDGIEEYIDEKIANRVDQVGISTGFKKYDFAIGGGLRRGTVNVIGARPKTGKTLMAMNMGIDIAKRGIPVLDLDTEMMLQDHKNRGLAMISYGTSGKSTINDIETGKIGDSEIQKQNLLLESQKYKDIPLYHKNIGGKPFEDQLSIMRRWLARVVGLNDQGKAKDCVIIYDYLKLMDAADLKSSDLKEFQLLGFMMTALHNFALRYEVPIICFIQLNRDGITKESTDTASGSDRVIWLCSNFSIYKQKSDEEIAKDGPENGNRKLVPVISRHGEGLESGDYINILMQGKYAKLIEGRTAYELNDGGDYVDDVDEDEQVDF